MILPLVIALPLVAAVTVPAHSPMLDFWPPTAWSLASTGSGNRSVASANSSTPVGVAFAFVGSNFTVEAMWYAQQADVNVTVDGEALPIDLAMPLDGALAPGAHAVNVSVVGAVRVMGVAWDGP